MKILYLILLNTFFAAAISAQHPLETTHTESAPPHAKHFIGLFLGNTVLYQTNIHLPTVGLEYVREITPRFGIGFGAEVEIGYEVINDKSSPNPSTLYHRQTAILFQPALFYRLYKGLIVYAGYGVEFEDTEDEKILGLSKIGIEYRLRMHNPNWLVLPSLSWDHTSHYDGVVYGVVFAYKF